MVDRAGLADFLRRRRELLRPADVGLPATLRRRTPGLRRDEVAHLAGMSTDYYSRLEQGRGSLPSAPVLAAIARALRVSLDERDHLFHLAGIIPPARHAGRHIDAGLSRLADHLVRVPVCICTDLNEVLWQNDLADVVMGSLGHRSGRERNFTWQWFAEPARRAWFLHEDWAQISEAHASDLRATHSRRGGDADVTALVNELLKVSGEFRTIWERHEVAVRRYDRKRLLHPQVGLLQLTCQVLLTPHDDLKLLALFPTEGTDAGEKLDLLRVIGKQDFQVTS